jgi:hypothetical protein
VVGWEALPLPKFINTCSIKKVEAVNTASLEQEIQSLKRSLVEERHRAQLQTAELKKDNELFLKEKEFELKHFKDEELKKLSLELSNAKQQIAVLTKENEMLAKITNLNADIIDIKSLVANLIDKLPEFKISNLTVNGNSGSKD